MFLRGAGALAQSLEVVQLAVVGGEFVRAEGRSQGVDRLVQDGAAAVEVHPQRLELLAYVPGAHPEDQAAAAEVVEGGVLLGGEQRVAQAHDRHMAEQADAFGDAREVGEGGDGVVPDGAHGRGQAVRDADVVAGRDVVEARPVGGPRDPDEVGGPRVGLPGLGVDGALGLHRELQPVGEGGHLGPSHRPAGVRPRRSIALPRTIRSTTSGARWPICASPTSRDFGQVESEWG